ncbi:MAG: stage II sporulation protein M [Candidatus Bathyarchaeia archaeon]
MTSPQPPQGGIARKLFGSYAEYMRGVMPIFALCSVLFLFSMSMGYALGGEMSGSSLQDLLGTFPDISNMGILELFGYVIANNAFKSLLFMVGGLLGGILPLFFVIFNGFFIGWVAFSLGSTMGLGFVVAGLVPHGIFEIPAIILAMSLGMKLGYALLNRLRGQGDIWREARLALGLFVNRVLPLLVLAAVIEVTVTPVILSLLGYL